MAAYRIGSLVPANGWPSWGQLYMLDAAEATVLREANSNCAESLRPAVLAALHNALQQHNPWVAQFCIEDCGESRDSAENAAMSQR